MAKEDYKLKVTDCCKYSDQEDKAVAQIKKWMLTLNRNGECCPDNIAISQHREELENGTSEKHTLICICDTTAPVIKVSKPVVEITLVDILSIYSKINVEEEVASETAS